MVLRKDRDPTDFAQLAEAIKDLEVKPKDNGALSLYVVHSRRQGRRITLLHQVTNNSPKALSFIFIPVSCFLKLSFTPEIVHNFDWRRQHPLLNTHHVIVYGLTDVAARLELVSAILSSNYKIVTWSRPRLLRRGRVLARKRLVRWFMKYDGKWT